MENSPNNTVLTPSYNSDRVAPEQSLATPHFDEISIQNARPAVPLAETKARRFWPLALVLMCASSVVGGVLGLALSRYENRAGQIPTPAVSVAPDGSRVSTESGSDRVEEKVNDVGQAAWEGNPDATRAARSRESQAVAGEPTSDAPDSADRATLNGALEEWIEATNARDIQRQMDFYNPTVNAFYRTRNVPRESVRAEKSRVFGRADLIDIKAAAPGIRVSRDGRTATMRFRKKYAIEGGGQDRRGEVVQELRWRRTTAGWKIVSERDLRVIN